MTPEEVEYWSQHKACTKCGVVQPNGAFSKRGEKLKSTCKECDRKISKAKYDANPEANRLRSLDHQKKRRERNQQYVCKYLQLHRCADCGNEDWRVLEFDHVDGVKIKAVSELMASSLEALKEEIAKCDVVCANCHRIRTYTRAGSWRSVQDILRNGVEN